MPLDPSIIGSYNPGAAPDVNAMLTQQMQGMQNINTLERQRAQDALDMEDRAAAQAKEQEDAAVKSLLPAYAHAFKTGDLEGALQLAPLELQANLRPYVDALAGKPLEEVQAALAGSLVTTEAGRAFLENQARMTTAGIQQGQLTVAQQREAREAAKAAAEAAGAGKPKVASREVDAQGNVHFFDEYGNEIRVAEGAGKPAAAATTATTPDQKTQAKEGVDGTLSRILDQYNILAKENAIVSAENTAAQNVGARLSTKFGPSVGRTIGTKAQTARDTIANLRQALLADIKAATGMSSKAIDSNVELKSFLDSLGDPDQSIETIKNTLAELSIKYGAGSLGDVAGGGGAAVVPPAANASGFEILGVEPEE